jgi:glycerophosphoryl diester phosphodiesterase
MKRRYKLLSLLGGISTAIYLGNASWLAGVPDGEMTLLAHRGVHQTYHRAGLDNETCTAARIDSPTHSFIENTIPSIRAALDHGAEIIELDVKLTTDGEIVVFHDATLDCRTDGTGPTHKQDLASLKSLDIGHGYTADEGETYPFRGQFFGAMPTLREVLNTFPDTYFMVNLKHGKASEGQTYLEYIQTTGSENLGLTASEKPARVVQRAHPDMIIQSRQNTKACLKGYVLTGWFGNVPDACHNNFVAVPSNFRHVIWGWPHRFEKRLNAVGSRSMLMGPYAGHGSVGLDEIDQLKLIPENYTGIIFTNKIEVVGPALRD